MLCYSFQVICRILAMLFPAVCLLVLVNKDEYYTSILLL